MAELVFIFHLLSPVKKDNAGIQYNMTVDLYRYLRVKARALVRLSYYGTERVMGIEPTSEDWKSPTLTVVLYPHTHGSFGVFRLLIHTVAP